MSDATTEKTRDGATVSGAASGSDAPKICCWDPAGIGRCEKPATWFHHVLDNVAGEEDRIYYCELHARMGLRHQWDIHPMSQNDKLKFSSPRE